LGGKAVLFDTTKKCHDHIVNILFATSVKTHLEEGQAFLYKADKADPKLPRQLGVPADNVTVVG
jgi:hypothetical protein